MEERVQNLENRVRELEHRLSVNKQVPEPFVSSPPRAYQTYQQPIAPVIPPERYQQPIASTIPPYNKQQQNKFGEALVGKYIIGALASLLVFVAAVSLIALVWNQMSAQAKLSLLVVIGLILTTIGFIRVKNHKDVITAILMGTGSGLLFLDILAANLAFDLISSNVAFLLAGAWSVFFILSYHYTQTFFTTIIAYIGSFVALLLGLSLVKGEMDYIVVIEFTVCISITMLVSGYRWFDHIRQLACTIFSFASMACLLVFGAADSQHLINNWFFYVLLFVVVIETLTNRSFYLLEKLQIKAWGVVLGGVAALLVMLGLYQLNFTAYVVIFSIVLLIQIIYVEWQDFMFTSNLTKMYACFLVFAVMILNIDSFDSPIGVSVVAILLIIIDERRRTSKYQFFVGGIVLLDSVFILFSGFDGSPYLPLFLVSLGIQLSVISYLLYKQYQTEISNSIIPLKMIGFFVVMTDIFCLILRIQAPVVEGERHYLSIVPSFLSITIAMALFFASGFFRNWSHENFRWFAKKSQVSYDKSVWALYIMTTVLYFYGLGELGYLESWYEQFMMIICVLAIALMQSANLLQTGVEKEWVGVWLGLKYCILTGVVLNVSFEQSVDSLAYSVSGLILALLCIAIGFYIKTKSLRLYGLILTILMVIKFIIVDLSQENSITRVLALMAGGMICFGISVLYNKLNTLEEEKNQQQK